MWGLQQGEELYLECKIKIKIMMDERKMCSFLVSGIKIMILHIIAVYLSVSQSCLLNSGILFFVALLYKLIWNHTSHRLHTLYYCNWNLTSFKQMGPQTSTTLYFTYTSVISKKQTGLIKYDKFALFQNKVWYPGCENRFTA